MKKLLFALLFTVFGASLLDASCATGQCPYAKQRKEWRKQQSRYYR